MIAKCHIEISQHDKKYPCEQPLYKDHGFCIFHSPHIMEKSHDFHKHFVDYVKHCNNVDRIKEYNFRGWKFPTIDLKSFVFKKEAYFYKSEFYGRTDFSKTKFLSRAEFLNCIIYQDSYFWDAIFEGTTSFSSCVFKKNSAFHRCQFHKDAYFANSEFEDITNFSISIFYDHVNFSDSKFHKLTQIGSSEFKKTTYFQNTKFLEDTNFNNCIFHDDVSFIGTEFSVKVDFRDAKFNGELLFHDSRLNRIKTVNAKGINFDGSILEEVSFWHVEKFIDFSFKDSFLLSVNFADRELINCNLTGAVMDAVRTRGWILDESTIKNTKYIYTDYTKELIEDRGYKGAEFNYLRVEESRVPADGNFGEGDNESFTIQDFLHESYKWSKAIRIPHVIKTAFIQYIQLFSDFSWVTEGINVQINTVREGEKIRVEFLTDSKPDKEKVEELFKKYLLKSREKDLENLVIEINHKTSKATELEQKMLIIDLKNQIQHLNTKFEYTQLLVESQNETIKSKNQTIQALNSFKEKMPLLLTDGAKEKHLENMRIAIEMSKKCKSEAGRNNNPPKVGAVIVKDNKVLATAFRGEEGTGDHAEFIALEKKLKGQTLSGAIVYTTLEPCTYRSPEKTACALRLIDRGISEVFIGILDPNPEIRGKGQRKLQKAGIKTTLFPHDLMMEIEDINAEFTKQYE